MHYRKSTLLLASAAMFAGTNAGAAASPADLFAGPPPQAFAATVGDLAPATPIRLVLALPLRDEAGAEAFARDVSTPASGQYGGYLTPAQFAARFGALPEHEQAAIAWARAHGLSIDQRSRSRTTVTVSGPLATIETLFATRLAAYRAPDGQPGFAPLVAPSLPDALAGHVVGVIGLASARHDATLVRRAAPGEVRTQNATGVGGGYSPADFRTAYVVPPQPTSQAPQTVAVFEQGGFAMADLTQFAQHYGLPTPPVTVRNVNGFDGRITNANVELEAVLDIDTVLGINPAVSQILVYEDGADPFPVALLDSLTAMADDDTAKTISISYGDFERNMGQAAQKAEHTALLQFAAQGQTVYASAGDNGPYDVTKKATFVVVLDPASQPGVTGVGGTTLFTGPRAAYEIETTWNLLASGFGATGGGFSATWALPAYQASAGGPDSLEFFNGGSNTNRNVPDVAADASPATGASVYSKMNGGWVVVGGTSLAAPLWAGFSSILNATREGVGLPGIGAFNPMLYTLGSTGFGIHDIVNGTNGDNNAGVAFQGYVAGIGADDVSGNGSFQGSTYLNNLIVQILDGKGDPPLPPPQVSDLAASPAETSATFSWTKVAHATGYLVAVYRPSTPDVITYAATTTPGATVSALAAGTPYNAYVYALNRGGPSESPIVTFTTLKN